MPNSYFIAIEGPDGAGKSTVVNAVVQRLRDKGVEVVQVREPGGTAAAELARRGAFDPVIDASDIAELFFILAARADLTTKVIAPALAQGQVVITDRYDLSTQAYQVAGRGLPADAVLDANRLATGGLRPDLTIILDIPASTGRDRQMAAGKTLDRMERASTQLHDRVAAFFRNVEGEDVVHVDATKSRQEVAEAVWTIVEQGYATVVEASQG